MPPGEGRRGAPPAAGGAGIDLLPDEVLQHIIGFLEAHESVRTCVLARRWRHLWKSAMVLRVPAGEGKFLGPVEKLCNFADGLLHLRGGSPLDTCELWFTDFDQSTSGSSYEDEGEDEDRLTRLVNTWFWYSVSCQVRVLILNAYIGCDYEPSLVLDNRHVNSQHLTRLEIEGVVLGSRFLNFSNCPSLEHLEFISCYFDSDGSRPHICAPSLVSLYLVVIWGKVPMLESICHHWWMHLLKQVRDLRTLVTWTVAIVSSVSILIVSVMALAVMICVLLKSLSEAEHLTLLSGLETFIFKRDLRWCPIFSNLKAWFSMITGMCLTTIVL